MRATNEPRASFAGWRASSSLDLVLKGLGLGMPTPSACHTGLGVMAAVQPSFCPSCRRSKRLGCAMQRMLFALRALPTLARLCLAAVVSIPALRAHFTSMLGLQPYPFHTRVRTPMAQQEAGRTGERLCCTRYPAVPAVAGAVKTTASQGKWVG
jgi:hypothetical protein